MVESGYAELGRQWEALVIRYRAGEKALITPILKLSSVIVTDFLRGKLYGSRQSATGVPYYIEAGDLISCVLIKVRRAIDGESFRVEEGKGKAFLLTVASNTFLDALAGKQGIDLRDPEEREAQERPGPARENLEGFARKGAFSADETEAYLLQKEILNLILQGLRELANPGDAGIFVARVFLGHGEKEVCELFSMKRATCASHFRRACKGILAVVRTHPECAELSFKSLRELVFGKLTLEEKDLDAVTDPGQKKALQIAAAGPCSAAALAEKLGMSSPSSAMAVLRAGIAILSRARLTRVKRAPAAGSDETLEVWLWEAVDAMLAAYPELCPVKRGTPPPSEDLDECAALVQVAIQLGFVGADEEAPKSLGELLGDKIDADRVEEEAKALGLGEADFMALLSGSHDPAKLDSKLLAKIATRYKLTEARMQAALRAGADAGRRRGTRGVVRDDDGRKYLDHALKRALEA